MADLKVVSFKRNEKAEHDHETVIEYLEKMLEYAKSEQCISVSAIMISGDGNVIDCFHNGGKPYVMIGAMEQLKSDFMASQIEPR